MDLKKVFVNLSKFISLEYILFVVSKSKTKYNELITKLMETRSVDHSSRF